MNTTAAHPLRPTLRFQDGMTSATVAKPSVDAFVGDHKWTGTGKVALELIPRPRLRVYCTFDDVDLTLHPELPSHPERLAELHLDGRPVSGFGAYVRPDGDHQGRVLAAWHPAEEPLLAVGDRRTRIRRLAFSLFNCDLKGRHDHFVQHGSQAVPIEFIELECKKWKLKISSLASTSDMQKDIREQGLTRLTHAGELVHPKGHDLRGKVVDNALDAIRTLLSFALGLPVDPTCPLGFDGGDQVVWARWSSPPRWDGPRLSWLNRFSRSDLTDLFAGFMERWSRTESREALLEVVCWYLNANDTARGVDGGIVFAYTALERLSFEHCVCDRKLVSQDGFDKLPAADRHRMLLASLDIPLAIPDSARSMKSHTAQKGRREWADGPEAIVQIRNDLAHGGRERSRLPADCYVEAWTLAVWFVEMAVLAFCGYGGEHLNRNTGDIETVPWAVSAPDPSASQQAS